MQLQLSTVAIRQGWLAVGWLGVLTVIYLSLTPSPPRLDLEHGDKLQHAAAYALLMHWFAQPALARNKRAATAVALVGLGVGLEFAQLASGYRTFSLGDMAAGAAGVALGWFVAPPRIPSLLSAVELIAARPIGD